MREGLAQAAGRNPDVILLDLGLPDGDGLDATRQLREWTSTPIIVLSARGQEQDKVAALDAGADDYLTKPFSVGELLARIRVALPAPRRGRRAARRLRGRCPQGGPGPPHGDGGRRGGAPHAHRVQAAGRAGEARRARSSPIGSCCSRYGGRTMRPRPRHLRVYVTQLRHKIEQDPARPRLLITEPGVGYRLKDA